ncbi:MAG: hypothetical protein M3069_19040 [Chloroflexota bacterium]|nr:hypothetical protein [Chloroflexota bacterium]
MTAGLSLGRRYAAVVFVALMSVLATHDAALAHDDPILTVRILCSSLTDGQIDAAMGEVDDNAVVLVDRPLVGRGQIQAWMVEQMAQNLRIEVVDVRPTPSAGGYAVTWTTRMFREDWRKAGIAMRQTTEQATIHNGRITQWTSSLANELAPGVAVPTQAVAPAMQPSNGLLVGGVPLSEIPITLLGLVGLLALVGCGLGYRAVRRVKQTRKP